MKLLKKREKLLNYTPMKHFTTLILLFYFIPFHSYSQQSDIGSWYSYLGNHTLQKKWNIWTETQYRSYNTLTDIQQVLIRTGLGYNVTENNNNILLGYAFVYSENYLNNAGYKTNNTEHRIFQQFLTKQTFNRFHISHRYRIEERFLSDDFQLRFRYMLLMNVTLNNADLSKGTWYAAASNEIFLNGQNNIFDRNRVYGGVGYVFNKNFRLEAGFMTQLQEKTNRSQFMVTLFNNFNFSTVKDE